jgi:CheY-like chemotaxis protein
MNVLFITDDDQLQTTAHDTLTDHGMDVQHENSITDAKELLDDEHPDFVVIDEHVKGGSAFDLFNYLLEHHPSVPAVIFADSMDDEEIERRPEKVLPYQSDKLELALDTLADTIEATLQFQTRTLYPEPEDEEERLQVLDEFDFNTLDDTDFYDELTQKGAETFDVPMCYVGIIDADEEQFLACHGVDFDAIEREHTICSYAIIRDDVMVVEDVQDDPRFRDMETIQQLGLEWYASAPITIDGHRIGTFCIADTKQHRFNEDNREQLQALADEFASRLEEQR